MRKILISMIILFMLMPARAFPADIQEGQTLSLEQCLQIAVTRHPDLASARARIDARESRLAQVQTAWKPEADLSSSYRRNSVTDDGYDKYSSSVGISKLLTDWNRTGTEAAVAALELRSSTYDYDNAVQVVLLDVKNAYFGLLRSQKQEEVAMESVNLNEELLERARGFYEVGNVSRYDVTKAEVDLSKARLDLIKARTVMKTSRTDLNNALGYPQAPFFDIEDMLTYEKIQLSSEQVMEAALIQRPDLKSLETKQRASQESIVLAGKSNSPTLSANGGYSWGDDSFTGDDDLYLGISLKISLYDGGLTKEKVNEARANLRIADADVESLKQDVVQGVEKAYLEVQDSEQAIMTAGKTVQQAEQNLELARGRYEVGVGSPIEVTDATENYVNARNSYYTALYDYRISLASLEKAIGGKVQ